jgi:hypothetical protein
MFELFNWTDKMKILTLVWFSLCFANYLLGFKAEDLLGKMFN